MLQRDSKISTIKFPNHIFLPEVLKYVNQGKNVTINLRGISMRPFLEDGRDKAVLIKPNNIKVGDAVLAELENKFYVLHRIIKIDGDKVVLRGDGNLGNEYCRLKDIRASVLGFYRKGRTTIDYTTGIKWKLYSLVWMRLYPLRRYLLYIYRKMFL